MISSYDEIKKFDKKKDAVEMLADLVQNGDSVIVISYNKSKDEREYDLKIGNVKCNEDDIMDALIEFMEFKIDAKKNMDAINGIINE